MEGSVENFWLFGFFCFCFPLVDWVLKNGKPSLEQDSGQDRAQDSQKDKDFWRP